MDLRIRLWVFVPAVLAIAPFLRAQSDATPASQVRVLAGELGTYAERWEAGELTEEHQVEVDAMLEVVRYDSASIGVVRGELSKARSPEDLFVVNRLLEPLRQAPASVVRTVLDKTQQLHRRFGRYQVPPRVPDRKLPEFRGTVSADVMMSSIAGSQRGTEEKIAAEMAMARRNAEVHALWRHLAHLTVLAEDKREDEALLRELIRLEKGGSMEYADIVDAIESAASRMDAERARFFYDALVELGNQLRGKKGTYQRPWEIIVRVMKTSTAVETEDYPGIRLLTAANALAPYAGGETLEVPTAKDIDQPAQRQPQRPRR